MVEQAATAGRPGPMAINVRKATQTELPRLTDAMARAFDDDPIANWFAAQDARRSQRIHEFMRVAVEKLTFPHGEVYTSDGIEGGALWNPPETWKMGFLQQLAMLPAFARVASFKRLPTIMKGLGAVEREHPHAPHFYLLALGVEPDLQGRSIGTQLMAPILAKCDREGIPAYLESSKERNVPLYERNGFKVTKEMVVPGGGPKIWLMWRDPQ
ncbi:MAG: GNAT family N-acetyltransferase [Dehalococcoidia bacterium]